MIKPREMKFCSVRLQRSRHTRILMVVASSAYEWRNETNYGCLESTCIPLTVSGGCEEFHLLVEDCWAVSDKRGKLPILEVFGQSL